jgi:type II secretory pathway component PulL
MPDSGSPLLDIRKLLAFGSGIGIEIGATDLEIVAARVRAARVRVIGRLIIAGYAERPAAEWGAEYMRFIRKAGLGHLTATVLLPRREVIIRQVMLPGVAGRDRENAIRFQLDTLHPYGEADVCWGWSPLPGGAALVGIVRRDIVERYAQLFAEAGIAVSSFTFSAAVLHAAVRLQSLGERAAGFLALGRAPNGGVEVYGESAARPIFSAEFDLAPQRASVLALAELRLPPDTTPFALEAVLPRPDANPVENDLSRNALPYATALSGACPWLSPLANVLPAEYRRSSSRTLFLPTIVLAALVLLTAGALAGYGNYADHRYLREIQAEIARLEPQARRAAVLDQQIGNVRARARQLEQFRAQTRADLDALNELTTLLEPPIWTNTINLDRDSARISGEAQQAGPLLKLLDASPQFQNSEFQVLARGASAENFQIHTTRRKRP